MAVKLNIPTTKDQFEEVSFVNDMTEYQLKVLIKRIWANLGELASFCDDTVPEVAKIIDLIREGDTWNKSHVPKNFDFFENKALLVKYDKKQKEIILYDRDDISQHTVLHKISEQEFNEIIKKRK